MVSPYYSHRRVGKPTARKAQRNAGKGGWKKRGLPVMGRIGIAPAIKVGYIIPRESGQTSSWSLTTRKLDQPAKEAKQMSAQLKRGAGAASHRHKTALDWHSLDWHKINQQVRRLQARIVEATKAG